MTATGEKEGAQHMSDGDAAELIPWLVHRHFLIAEHNYIQINYNACNWNQATVNTVINSYDYDYCLTTPVAVFPASNMQN